MEADDSNEQDVAMRKPKGPNDADLIPRLEKYLEEHVHQTYVDVDAMAQYLQDTYPDYARRKKVPFRNLVDEAYKMVLMNYGLDSDPASDDDNSEYDELEEDNLELVSVAPMNNMMTNMYLNKPGPRSAGVIELASTQTVEIAEPLAGPSGVPGPKSKKHFGSRSSSNSNGNMIAESSNGNGPLKTSGSRGIGDNSASVTDDTPINISSDEEDYPPPKHDQRSEYIPHEKVAVVRMLEQAETHKINKRLPKYYEANLEGYPIIPKKRKLETHVDKEELAAKDTSDIRTRRQARPTKKFKREYKVEKSAYTFKDIGGIDNTLRELAKLLTHVKVPELFKVLGLPTPRGILLHGPPGCGKTLLAQAVAGQLNINLIQVAATDLVGGVSGESEERIRDLFEQAALAAPCVLFIDEIEAISSNRVNASKDMERRMVSQLIMSLNRLPQLENGEKVVVIGATSRTDAIDPSLRCFGRFDYEISLGIPDRDAREAILKIICSKLRLASNFDYAELATLTPGFVGGDLFSLAMHAGVSVAERWAAQLIQNREKEFLEERARQIDEGLESTQKTAKDDLEIMKPAEVPFTDDDSMPAVAEKQSTETGEKEADKGDKENLTDSTANEVPMTEVKESPTSEDVTMVQSSEESLGQAMLKNESIKRELSNELLFRWLSLTEATIEAEEMENVFITLEDFKQVVKTMKPSSMREGFFTVPDVTWDDIGSLRDIREELKMAILAPVKYPERLKALGVKTAAGVLLCGPPGCGKTLLAKAIANEAGINFISIKGPEMLNMYVGESERAVRLCFQRGRNSTPCVIFFDEFDALCPKRSSQNDGSGPSRLVNQLLTEMDGVEDRKGVFVMAATNRPDMIDPAILRPGRLDKILYVGLPEKQDRLEILRAITKNGKQPQLAADVNLEEIAEKTESYTGADLSGIVRQAAFLVLKDSMEAPSESEQDIDLTVHKHHFLSALAHLPPSVSAEDKMKYEKLRVKFTARKENQIKNHQIFVNSINGKTIILNVDPSDKIDMIKSKFGEEARMNISDQYLVFEGNVLEDNRTLHDYQIPHLATLDLQMKLHGGSDQNEEKIERDLPPIHELENDFIPRTISATQTPQQ